MPTYALMLLLITVMGVIFEKTLQVNIARLGCHIFYRWWYFDWGVQAPSGYAYGTSIVGHRVNSMP